MIRYKKIIFSLIFMVNFADASYIKDSLKEIIIDTSSGLIWQDDINTKTLKKTWLESINYCESLTLGEYSDWRLPNFNELYMLVDTNLSDSVINPVFENTSTYYWSSTTYASSTQLAWAVYFVKGSDSGLAKTDLNYVRCVR